MNRFWLRLDNAALIFPAIRQHNWTNVFRQSITLTEAIDPDTLQRAVAQLTPRFPSLNVRLKAGVFWYYLEQSHTPVVHPDYAWPATFMSAVEMRTCCLRVLYHENRIAVEFFHALTDGSGGLVYLKTLAARYLSLRRGVEIPPTYGVLDWQEEPQAEELEDSFLRYAGKRAIDRKEADSYRLRGNVEHDDFLHLVTGVISARELVEKAHEYHATVTAFLCAVMTEAICAMQDEQRPLRRQKPVKITVPVDLRRLYGSGTLRNFALPVNPGIDPSLGTYTLQDLCDSFTHQIAADATRQLMAARIAANVQPQKLALLKLAPLPIKNLAMRAVYNSVGETKGCLNISNLGLQRLPRAMAPYVKRLEFIIGVQRTYPNNCSVVTYGDVTCINMIRNIQEAELEQRFFSRLVELGVGVSIESNER